MNTTLFDAWAPEGAPWSPWAKPVLFASEAKGLQRAAWEAARARSRGVWAPGPAGGDSALVLDLDGPLALALSLDCAALGWRPVPLFNSCHGPSAVLDNEPLLAGLEEGAPMLARLALPERAPPAFVLDARRTSGKPAPSLFDNRWVVFPQDFPSAARLSSSGVRRAILVQDGRRDPRDDLAHVLLRWQRAGIEILAVDVASAGTGAPSPLAVKKPRLFRWLGYRILIALGLRRSSAGGFGAVVPVVVHSGGFG